MSCQELATNKYFNEFYLKINFISCSKKLYKYLYHIV